MKNEQIFLVTEDKYASHIMNHFIAQAVKYPIRVAAEDGLAFYYVNDKYFGDAVEIGKNYLIDNKMMGEYVLEDSKVAIDISMIPVAVGLLDHLSVDYDENYGINDIYKKPFDDIVSLAVPEELNVLIHSRNKMVIFTTFLSYAEGRNALRKQLEICNNPFIHIYDTDEKGKILKKSIVSGRN